MKGEIVSTESKGSRQRMNSPSCCESLVIRRDAAVNFKKKKLLDVTLREKEKQSTARADSRRTHYSFTKQGFQECRVEISGATAKKKHTGGATKVEIFTRPTICLGISVKWTELPRLQLRSLAATRKPAIGMQCTPHWLFLLFRFCCSWLTFGVSLPSLSSDRYKSTEFEYRSFYRHNRNPFERTIFDCSWLNRWWNEAWKITTNPSGVNVAQHVATWTKTSNKRR